MKTYLRHLFLVVFLVILSTSGDAQVVHEERIEFELKEGYEQHNLAKFGDQGVLMYSKQRAGNLWKIERYNTDLELAQSKKVAVPKNQRFDETYQTKTDLLLFFKNNKGAYTLHQINANDLSVTTQQGAFPKKSNVIDLKVMGDIACFHVIVRRTPFLYTVNLESGREKLVPLNVPNHKPDNLTVKNMQVQESSEEIFIYVNGVSKKEVNTYVIKLDKDGNKGDPFHLTDQIDKNLTSISATPVKDGGYIYTGTYSSEYSNTSEGIYICKTINEEVNFIKFYNFLDFDEFLSYLSDRRKEKIEKKKSKKERRGKEFSLNYFIASHDIIEKGDQYLFLGEAYYPTYRAEHYTDYINGRAVQRTRWVFDGYQYTHAALVGFDKEGNKLWDRTFEMWPSYKPYYAKEFISVSEDDELLKLLFAGYSVISSKSFLLDGTIQHESSSDIIETGSESDKVKQTFSTNVDYWYGNHFLAHGNQKIKNGENATKSKKRRVYFINKISYE